MLDLLELPNRGPYDPMYADLDEPEDGTVHSQMPPDEKFYEDPDFYDTLGRSLVEQRKVFTAGRSNEEQVDMIHVILEQCPTGPDGISRAWDVALEAAIKNAAAVMQYLVSNKNIHATVAPEQASGLKNEVHIAASNGNLDVLKVLIEGAGADIDGLNDFRTPLSIAALNGEIDTVKWLIDHGADCSKDEETLTMASFGGNLEVFKMLLDLMMKKEPNTSRSQWFDKQMLGNAAAAGSEETLRFVMELGGYGVASENSEDQRAHALEAIPRAFKNDKTNQACVDLAIDCALLRDQDGDFIRSDDSLVFDCLKSAIANCCIRGKPDDLRKMLELVLRCTHVSRESAPFQQLLAKAIRGCYHPKSKACAKELLDDWDASANTNDPEEDHFLPIAPAAISYGDMDYVKYWLDHGADIHRGTGPFANGPTALCWAVKLGHAEAVLLFLEHGGPVDHIADGLEGLTRLCVRSTGELGIISLLPVEQSNGEVTEDSEAQDEDEGDEDEEDADGMDEDDEAEGQGGAASDKSENTSSTDTDTDEDEGDESEYAEEVDEVVIELEEVTKAWLERIQLRRAAADLAQDGTGRPIKEVNDVE